MLVKFVTTVKANRAAAWAFVADFSNIGAWDPGVKAAKKARVHLPRARDGRQKRLDSFHKSHSVVTFAMQTSAGETGVGSTYDLTTVFKGSESEMRCAPLGRGWLMGAAACAAAACACRTDSQIRRRGSYAVKLWDPPNKVVVTGDSSSVSAEDAIVFSDGATPGSTTIEYTVRLFLEQCGSTADAARALPRRTSS